MTDIADMMLDGTLCQVCGIAMDDMESPGSPRTCEACSWRAWMGLPPEPYEGASAPALPEQGAA